MRARRAALLIATFLGFSLGAGDPKNDRPLAVDDAPLDLLDVAAYEAAFREPSSSPAASASFRAIWADPEAFRGRRIEVRGRIRRVFAREAVGQLPPLVEAWAFTAEGDPFCLVAPRGRAADLPKIGSEIRFDGRFIKRVRYRAADTDRLALLVAGPHPPTVLPNVSSLDLLPSGSIGLDGMIAIVLGLVVAAILLARWLDRPTRRPIVSPKPDWLNPSPEDEADETISP